MTAVAPCRLLTLALLAATAWSPVAGAVQPVGVTVTDKGCEPATLEVPAGKTQFQVKNASRRALEWEILKGVMVVDERENILPGFTQDLTTTLDAGDYQMTCGLLSNPKGVLRVAATEGAPPGPPSAMDLVGPIAEYKVYVTREVEQLVAATKIFAAAVKSGNLQEAQRLYAPTRRYYERIEPIAAGELGEDRGDVTDDVLVADAELAEALLGRAEEELVEPSTLDRLLHASGV